MEKKHEPVVPYRTKIGRELISNEMEIGKHLKSFEASGGSDNPALHNLLIVLSKYVTGQQQTIVELVGRVSALEVKK